MHNLLDVMRNEKKFQLSVLEASQLANMLKNVLILDRHVNSNSGYLVRSLYFDTPYNKDYYEKSDGMLNRQKIRLRVYSSDADCAKLELKEKENNSQRKRSLILTKEQAQQMILGNYECLRDVATPFSLFLYATMNEQAYRPVCIVEYDRLAFYVPTNDTRITLDSSLRANEADHDIFSSNIPLYPVGTLSSTVLEVKYNNFLLSYVKDLLSYHEHMQISVSKYCMARSAVLRGDE